MSQYKDRVRGTTLTTGTGTLTVLAAPTGFQGFNTITSGQQVYYCCKLNADWEVGIGTVTIGADTLLARNTVLGSSNAGALVNFPAGTKEVYTVVPAAVLQALEYDGTLRHADFSGNLKGGSHFVTGIVTPANLTANTNDWAPALGNVSRVRVSCNAGIALTGIAGGTDGKVIYLTNVGANTLTLRDESTSSAAGNRLSMNGDQLLPSNTTAVFIYDSSISRWSKVS